MCVCSPTVIAQGGMVFAPGAKGRWRQCSVCRLAALVPFSVSSACKVRSVLVHHLVSMLLCTTVCYQHRWCREIHRCVLVCFSEWISSLDLCFQETRGIHVTDRRTPTLLFSFSSLLSDSYLSHLFYPRPAVQNNSLNKNLSPTKKRDQHLMCLFQFNGDESC